MPQVSTFLQRENNTKTKLKEIIVYFINTISNHSFLSELGLQSMPLLYTNIIHGESVEDIKFSTFIECINDIVIRLLKHMNLIGTFQLSDQNLLNNVNTFHSVMESPMPNNNNNKTDNITPQSNITQKSSSSSSSKKKKSLKKKKLSSTKSKSANLLNKYNEFQDFKNLEINKTTPHKNNIFSKLFDN